MMKPGEHLVVIGQPGDAVRARLAGLHLRDTLLIVLPGPRELFAYLFRAPLEGTVAENVVKYGCGGLNIDGCRVATGDSYNRAPACSGFSGISGYVPGSGRMTDTSTAGRWPTNLLLVHGPGCKQVGTKKVHPGGGGIARIFAGTTPGIVYGGGKGRGYRPGLPDMGYVGEDGLETVPNWDCQPGCPVKLLDEQSGTLQTGGPVYQGHGPGGFSGNIGGMPTNFAGDSGGASRFFPQFKSLPEALDWLTKLISERR